MDTQNFEAQLCLSTTSPLSPELAGDGNTSLVDGWLVRFAADAGQPIDDVRLAEWRENFSGVEPAVLERAFQAVLRAQTFNCIPMVGKIWTQIGEDRRADLLEEQQVERERWLSAQPPWEELHRRGRNYCEQVRAYAQEIGDLQERPPSRVTSEPIVIALPERLSELEEQKRQILARYPRRGES